MARMTPREIHDTMIALKRAVETDANAEEIAAVGKERFEAWIPLSRLGTSNDVAKTAAFLVSDDAGYITGTTITIDGGYVLNLVRYDPRGR